MRPTGSSGLRKWRGVMDIPAEEDRNAVPLIEHQSQTCSCRKPRLDGKSRSKKSEPDAHSATRLSSNRPLRMETHVCRAVHIGLAVLSTARLEQSRPHLSTFIPTRTKDTYSVSPSTISSPTRRLCIRVRRRRQPLAQSKGKWMQYFDELKGGGGRILRVDEFFGLP
jgi:hypothetical protein